MNKSINMLISKPYLSSMDRITSLIYTHIVPGGSVAEEYCTPVSLEYKICAGVCFSVPRSRAGFILAARCSINYNLIKQNLIFSMSFLKPENLVIGNSSPP